MRKFVLVVTTCLILSMNLFQGAYADEFNERSAVAVIEDSEVDVFKTELPRVNAGAAIVMDMKSGRVMYEKNAYSIRAIASTTKIMTAIVAIENGNLDDVVTVSKRAAGIWGSNIKLKTGETLTLKELLYGLMMESGNDAAIAIAEHIGGSVENFASIMNDKALDLGANNTHFTSPHGLDAEGHYSTAYDLAVITKYALKNPIFCRIVSTVNANIPNRSLHNTNEMLGIYSWADGVKTGYTGQAGRCLVTSATRNGWRIISVVLNCPTRNARAQSSKTVLDYAFQNFKPKRLLGSEEQLGNIKVDRGKKGEVPVLAAEEIDIPLSEEELSGLKREIDIQKVLKAPVYRNIEIGTIKYVSGGRVIAQAPVITGMDVPAKNAVDYFKDIIINWCAAMRDNHHGE